MRQSVQYYSTVRAVQCTVLEPSSCLLSKIASESRYLKNSTVEMETQWRKNIVVAISISLASMEKTDYVSVVVDSAVLTLVAPSLGRVRWCLAFFCTV